MYDGCESEFSRCRCSSSVRQNFTRSMSLKRQPKLQPFYRYSVIYFCDSYDGCESEFSRCRCSSSVRQNFTRSMSLKRQPKYSHFTGNYSVIYFCDSSKSGLFLICLLDQMPDQYSGMMLGQRRILSPRMYLVQQRETLVAQKSFVRKTSERTLA
jgi:hypothetical protein